MLLKFFNFHSCFYLDNSRTLQNVFVNWNFQKFFSRTRCLSLWQPFVCRQQRWSRRAQVWVPSSQSHLRQTGNNNITTMINKRLTFRIQNFSMKWSLIALCNSLFVVFSASLIELTNVTCSLSIRSSQRS